MNNSAETPSTPDYYADLGVSQTESQKGIRQAFLKLARTTHPDKRQYQSNDAADFRKIREAYGFLSDPIKRTTYDKTYYNVQAASARHYRQRHGTDRKQGGWRATKEQTNRERRSAGAEKTRIRKELRRTAEEQARRDKLREEKTRQDEERSRNAERQAWENRQLMAEERLRGGNVLEDLCIFFARRDDMTYYSRVWEVELRQPGIGQESINCFTCWISRTGSVVTCRIHEVPTPGRF
ncbi:DnaJ domain-containing protein [Xylariaceae sp. AK1471]|nr:DnaJ domain-containing protein [Xylariaceae sp. AK1471]